MEMTLSAWFVLEMWKLWEEEKQYWEWRERIIIFIRQNEALPFPADTTISAITLLSRSLLLLLLMILLSQSLAHSNEMKIAKRENLIYVRMRL
jgi:glucose dehydrogenase